MSNAARPPRTLFFGMRCAFSVPPLRALIAAGHEIAAVVIPGPVDGFAPAPRPGALPMAGMGEGIDRVAAAAGLPLLTLRGLRLPHQLDLVRALAPEAIAVACFPWKLPAALRAAVPLGCLNLHPSLLPRWRGPEPLFWTFHCGDAEAGVTVHLMDDGYDTGPILLQEALPLPDLAAGDAVERELAERGGQLLARALAELAAGRLEPRPQDDAGASYAPTPTDADLILRTDVPARQLANAVAGIVPLWGPVTIESHLSGQRMTARHILHVETNDSPGAPVLRTYGRHTVRCQPGTVSFAVD